MRRTMLAVWLGGWLLQGCGALPEETYPDALVWNDSVYLFVERTEPSARRGGKIGEVTERVEPYPERNGQSNAAPVGSGIYAVAHAGPEEEAMYLLVCSGQECRMAASELGGRIITGKIYV